MERNELVQHLAEWHDLPEGLSQGERTEDLRAWHDRDHLTIDPATHKPFPKGTTYFDAYDTCIACLGPLDEGRCTSCGKYEEDCRCTRQKLE